MSPSVNVDAKGRIQLPKAIRDQLGLLPGDAMFIKLTGKTIRCAKAANPFDGLADYAEEDYQAGRTRALRDIIRSRQLPDER